MTDASSNIKIVSITDEAGFLAIKNVWNELVEVIQPGMLFYRHEWYEAMRKWHHGACSPYILLVYKANNLIGICPMMLCHSHHTVLNYRMLGFLMIPASPYHDIICRKTDSQDIMQAVLTYLDEHQTDWDIFDLRHLKNEALALQYIQDNRSSIPFSFIIGATEYDSIIDLSGNWEDYYQQRSRHLRKNNNNAANRLENMGNATVHHFSSEELDDNNIGKLIDEITIIASNSWKSGSANDLSKPAAVEYLCYLLHQPRLRQGISLWILRLDDIAIAYEVQLCEHRHVYALHADFHNSYERLSPGSYLNHQIIQQLFDSDSTTYHMGSGGQPYKKAWENERIDHYQVQIYRKSVKATALRLLNNIKTFI